MTVSEGSMREIVSSKYSWLLSVLLLLGMIPSVSLGAPLVLSDVPAYNWYHGCTPTAIASVIGYWDVHGYPNLFTASGSDVFLTANVQDQISSPEHNAKYDPTPDNASLPTPPMTSIADWTRTSEDPRQYGWTSIAYTSEGIMGYSAYRGYTLASWQETFSTGSFTWNDLVSEINSGNPMVFHVDSNADGTVDHSVPVLGYDDRGADGLWYAMYTTWSESETIEWEPFRGMSANSPWGVEYATFAHVASTAAVPEPSTLLLLGSWLLGLAGLRRKFKK
jgi:hypothetical protein